MTLAERNFLQTLQQALLYPEDSGVPGGGALEGGGVRVLSCLLPFRPIQIESRGGVGLLPAALCNYLLLYQCFSFLPSTMG